MTTVAKSLLLTLAEVEHHLQMTHTWLAEMSKQDSEMRTYIKRWTVPRNRYEKRVGKANAFFERMDWDEIMAFAQMREQECVHDPWKFWCMLEHLSHRFQVKMEIFKDVIRHMRTAVAKTREVLEIGIPDSEAKSYQELLEENILSLTTMIMEVQTAITQQRDKAVEVSQQLENDRRPVYCAEVRKASAPALPRVLW